MGTAATQKQAIQRSIGGSPITESFTKQQIETGSPEH
jgi:hypothetical protein